MSVGPEPVAGGVAICEISGAGAGVGALTAATNLEGLGLGFGGGCVLLTGAGSGALRGSPSHTWVTYRAAPFAAPASSR